VASTNVYGDIAGHIGGDAVTVTSIISDPSMDPHSYEANAQNLLALSRASVVIENGGGYDDFIDTMLDSANNPGVRVINVVEVSGRTSPAGGELNEHVWYDFPTVSKLADELAAVLGSVDSPHTAMFTANAAAFKQKLAQLEATEKAIKSAHGGIGVAITEPVPLYLLEAAGLENKTPEQFSRAVEEGTDVPAAVLQQMMDLFTAKQVAILAYNAQTTGPQTQKVLDAAKANKVAVVPFTETLPAGQDYLTWMGDNLTAIQTALA
jgi:zinc/manganese transport system substrate-binding protein